MATKPLKSIKWPNLPDRYWVVQADGSYQQMTVGNAEQLVATVGIEDKVPYNFRTSGGANDIGDREVDKIIGGTVAWNQYAKELNATNWSVENANVTVSFSNGVATFSSTQASYGIKTSMGGINPSHRYLITLYAKAESALQLGVIIGSSHGSSKTFDINTSRSQFATIITTSSNVSGPGLYVFPWSSDGTSKQIEVDNIAIFDLTQMFGSTIADYIYTLEQSTAGAGVAFFRSLFPAPYYAYNAGELMHVQTSAHKMTGFNQWDEEWEVGQYDTTTGAKTTGSNVRSKNLIPVLPDTTYRITSTSTTSALAVPCFYYDANGQFIDYVLNSANATTITPPNAYFMAFYMGAAYGTTYKNDICINLHWDGERDGEYEPYEAHTYPLDDVELRGIPKLDANNNLYYDGDTYEADGTVTRKYGIVDLGTLERIKDTTTVPGQTIFRAQLSNAKDGYEGICGKYPFVGSYSFLSDKTCAYIYNTRIAIVDSTYADGDSTAFATAMSGVYLVYELATPTTESADPFQNPQIVNDWGTEEYVDSRTVPIPVGHDTMYRANLRAKLEMAPDSPSANGNYIMRHENGENAYVLLTKELPTLPTTDGTYHLKCTVASGTATLTWEEDQA